MSTLMHVNHQISSVAGDTLSGKHKFEEFASSVGVEVKAYHADNHIFNSAEYLEDRKDRGQKITFCGVEAHHQNGCAERAIKTIVS